MNKSKSKKLYRAYNIVPEKMLCTARSCDGCSGVHSMCRMNLVNSQGNVVKSYINTS
jgi:hypothetical protein